jgi:hypothetical protein
MLGEREGDAGRSEASWGDAAECSGRRGMGCEAGTGPPGSGFRAYPVPSRPGGRRCPAARRSLRPRAARGRMRSPARGRGLGQCDDRHEDGHEQRDDQGDDGLRGGRGANRGVGPHRFQVGKAKGGRGRGVPNGSRVLHPYGSWAMNLPRGRLAFPGVGALRQVPCARPTCARSCIPTPAGTRQSSQASVRPRLAPFPPTPSRANFLVGAPNLPPRRTVLAFAAGARWRPRSRSADGDSALRTAGSPRTPVGARPIGVLLSRMETSAFHRDGGGSLSASRRA